MLAQGRKRTYSQAGVGTSTAPVNRGPPVKKARKPLTKRIARLEKINKKQQKSRSVREFNSGGTNVNYTAPLLLKFDAQQGGGPGGYSQSEAFAQTGIFSLGISMASRGTNYNNNAIRVIIGFIRHEGAAATASTVCSELFNSTTPNVFHQYAYKHLSPTEGLGTKYIIKSDKVHTWNPGNFYDGQATVTNPYCKFWKEVVSFKNVKMEWDAAQHAGVAPPEYNCPFMLVISQNGTGCDILYRYRQWFTHEACV